MGAPDLFELFFLSTTGSASHYEQTTNGKYVCKELPPEQTEKSAYSIKLLQDAACAFVQDFKKIDDDLNIDLDPMSVSAGYRQFILHINNKDIEELRQFSFLSINQKSLVPNHNMWWYILRPQNFIKDFFKCGTKALFLKSLIKLPLPYVYIIDTLKKFDK